MRATPIKPNKLFVLWLVANGLVSLVLTAPAETRYVNLNNAAPASPYTSWATAATNIQDAVDAAVAGDEILVTNGVYQTGATAVYGMSNRVAVTKALTVRSVNGPEVTSIVGLGPNGTNAVRCVYLTNGAVLAGFTLTNGATQNYSYYESIQSGGGVWCEGLSTVVSNCVLTGNSAYLNGGGAYLGTLNNCVLAGNSANEGGGAYHGTLNNCTVTGNSAFYGGGARSGTLNNCTLTGNSAGDEGGGAMYGTLNNCVLTGNSALHGGGASVGTLNNCTLTGNSASDGGGGAISSTLNNCVLTGNSASGSGGGASYGTLNNCVLTGNSASDGGGAYGSDLHNCAVRGNSATRRGGGVASGGQLHNCELTGNSAAWGGGASGVDRGYDRFPCHLYNCTVTGNTATSSEGGVYECLVSNSIVYYNSAPIGPNYLGKGGVSSVAFSSFDHSCTTPLPPEAAGNIDLEPQLASASRLSATSPCIGAGSPDSASGTDIDGEAWSNPPSIGCDEYHAGAVTGPLNVAVTTAWTNAVTGYPLNFVAWIEGRTSASAWYFGDGTVASNRLYANHAWTVSGVYPVVLRAWNDSNPSGVSATATVYVVEAPPVHYVAADSASPTWPFASWATAARTIQEAVDAAGFGAVVLVSNGVYATGGRPVKFGAVTNRVTVDKPLTLQSVNGPQFTIIQGAKAQGGGNGDGAIRCVYLTDGAVLSGFTLTNGATQSFDSYHRIDSGGGVWCESIGVVLSNCVLTSNSADWFGGGVYQGRLNNCVLTGNFANYGGGVYSGTLNNCMLTGNAARYNGGGANGATLNNCTLTANTAYSEGGGAYSGTLNNCTLTGNSAWDYGGGSYHGTLDNCVVYYNNARLEGANHDYCTLNFCCTTPLPAGTGNLTNAPLFVDTNGWSDLRLQVNSPCINAGNNSYVSGTLDLDGNPRIAGGTVDLGAYEFQSPASQISYAWLQQYLLPNDGSADFTDPDGDGLNNWQEWRCDTVPTNALSVLRLLTPLSDGANLSVSWESVTSRVYSLERSSSLNPGSFQPLATNLAGQSGLTAFVDTNAASTGPHYYRVGVH